MLKKKTNKAAAKRCWKTAGGKIKFAHPGRGHLLAGKTRKHKRRLRKPGLLSAPERKRISGMLA